MGEADRRRDMSRLTEFFNTPQGAAAGRAIAKVFSGAAVVAAMSAALPVSSAGAFPLSAAVRIPQYSAPEVNYQDVMAFDLKLQPLKEQKEAYKEMILGYGDLLQQLRDSTYEQGEISPREQIEIYREAIVGWVDDTRQAQRDAEKEEEEANIVDASATVKMKHGSDARVFQEAYRKVAERNVELRESIERMTASLTVITIYGEAGVDEVEEAFKSYKDFERELVTLKVAEPEDAGEELVSSPNP
jgi:hypothetical protein